MARTFYAIVYAYGRGIANNGQRADIVHRFDSVAARTRFLNDQEQDADPVAATDARVKRAIRYAAHLDWPQAV